MTGSDSDRPMTRALGTPQRGQITVVAVVLLAMIVPRTLDPYPAAKGSTALPEALDQAGQVRRHRRLEMQGTIVDGMTKRETTGVQRLARERNGARVIRPVHVSLLAHEHMAAQPCLKTNLV